MRTVALHTWSDPLVVTSWLAPPRLSFNSGAAFSTGTGPTLVFTVLVAAVV